jgi:polar amino acid transport system substrate-binding protein
MVHAMTTRHSIPIILAALLGTLLVSTFAANAQHAPDPRIADIVQAGKLRVGYGLGAPATSYQDPKTGELRGLAVDLGRALAARMGVEFQPVINPRPGAILQGLQTNAWDVTFLAFEPARTAQADFATPYMQNDYAFLVLGDSAIQCYADVDQPGIRIATPRGDSSDLHVSRLLQRAEMVRTESFEAGLDLLRTKQVHAFTASRVNVMGYSEKIPGSRVLEEGVDVVYFAGVVPKGQPGRLAYLTDFIEQAKASGLVKLAIEREGLRGVHVAPPGNPK